MHPVRTLFGAGDDALGRVRAQYMHLHKLGILPAAVQPLTVDQFRAIIETAFWATLKIDEGRSTRVRIAVVPRGLTMSARYALQHPRPFTEQEIAKLAPAVPAHGFLVATVHDEKIAITGIDPSASLDLLTGVVVECYEPGIVRVGLGPYQPYVVFSGPMTVFTAVPRHTTFAAHLMHSLGRPFRISDVDASQTTWRECLALADLAREVVNGGHGGTLLVVPGERGDWLQSLDPYPFQLARPDDSVPNAIREELRDSAAQGDGLQRLFASSLSDEEKAAIMVGMVSIPWKPHDMSRIASLAAVDGAVVIGPDVRVYGFGAKIRIRDQEPFTVSVFSPEPGGQAVVATELEAAAAA